MEKFVEKKFSPKWDNSFIKFWIAILHRKKGKKVIFDLKDLYKGAEEVFWVN